MLSRWLSLFFIEFNLRPSTYTCTYTYTYTYTPASPSLVASWGSNLNRDRTSGEDLIDVATLSGSQFLIRDHFDQRFSGGNERRRLCVGGAPAPPTHSHPRSLPPLSRWSKWTLTRNCEAVSVGTSMRSSPEVRSMFKFQPQLATSSAQPEDVLLSLY